MLSLSFEPATVILSDQPERFLNLIASRNDLDQKLYAAANVSFHLHSCTSWLNLFLTYEQEALDEKISIVGRETLLQEVAELKKMAQGAREVCSSPARARDLLHAAYDYRKDCLWHDQVRQTTANAEMVV